MFASCRLKKRNVVSLSPTWFVCLPFLLASCGQSDDDGYYKRLAERHRIEGLRLMLSKQYGPAHHSLEKSLQAAEQIKSVRLPLALALTALGDLALKEKQAAEAVPLYQRANSVYKEAWLAQKNSDKPPYFVQDMMTNAMDLARALLQSNKIEEAETEYKMALDQFMKWWRDLPDQRREICFVYVSTLVEHGRLQLAQAKYSEAEESFEQALRLGEDIGQPLPETTLAIKECLEKLEAETGRRAKLLMRITQTGQAKTKAVTTIPATASTAGQPALPPRHEMLLEEGRSYHARGDYLTAQKRFTDALAEAMKCRAEPVKIAQANEYLADSLYVQAKHQEALPYYLKSRRIKEQIKSPCNLDYCLHQLGNLYSALGQLSQAEEAYRKSAEIKKNIYGQSSKQFQDEQSLLQAVQIKMRSQSRSP